MKLFADKIRLILQGLSESQPGLYPQKKDLSVARIFWLWLTKSIDGMSSVYSVLFGAGELGLNRRRVPFVGRHDEKN